MSAPDTLPSDGAAHLFFREVLNMADEEKPKKNDRRWNVPDKTFDNVNKILEQKKKREEAEKKAAEEARKLAEENPEEYADENHGIENIDEIMESMEPQEELNVPEIETSVVDLPPEDENEKQIVVDHNPEEEPVEGELLEEPNAEEPIAEEPIVEEPNDNTKEGVVDVTPPNDKTMSDGEPAPEEIEDPSIIENDPDIEDDVVTDKKVGDTRKPNRVEDDDLEDNNKKEEVMSDEDALKEAQELAQDDLEGFKISGKTWSKMTDKQKADAIKAFKDSKKGPQIEDNRTTNNFAAYERYPTGLRVAEDVGQVLGKGVDLAKEIAEKPLNGTSIDDAVQRAKAIPHYDYTSLFGRR